MGTASATLILSDTNDVFLGYEGSHVYKINGKYYVFVIHMPKSTARRTEAVFVADKPGGPYYGKDGKKQLSFFMVFILVMTLFITLKITAHVEAKEITGIPTLMAQ